MDISHITHLLSNLGKNQVTLPIKDNSFQETLVDDHYKAKLMAHDPFEGLDDIATMAHKYKPIHNQTKRQTTAVGKPRSSGSTHVGIHPQQVQKPLITQVASHNLVYALASLKDTMLTLQKNQDKINDVSNKFLTELRDYVSQCTSKKLGIETINRVKVSKANLLDYLKVHIETDSVELALTKEQRETIVRIASQVVRKNIVVYDEQDGVLCKEYIPTNDNVEEYIIIKRQGNTNFVIGDSISQRQLEVKCENDNIRKLKEQDEYEEKLKNLSVKDLRAIANDIGVETIDTHTGKLLSKTNLKLLVEAKVKQYS